MNKNSIVLDSSVIVKVFVQEDDREQTIDLLKYLNLKNIKIIAPELLITETLNVCLAKNVTHDVVLDYFNDLKGFGLIMPSIEQSILVSACKIAESGNQKSGFPSFNDSVYHAMAKSHNTFFITADNRHKAKTEKEGHIVLLKDWEQVFKK